MNTKLKTIAAGTLAIALAACSTNGTAETESASASQATTDTPFPSTYEPYPGASTALVGATIYDGVGGRIDNGTVFFSGGKIVSIGGPDTPVPARQAAASMPRSCSAPSATLRLLTPCDDNAEC